MNATLRHSVPIRAAAQDEHSPTFGLPPDVIHPLLFSFDLQDEHMLTVPGLCWLCRMPLALVIGGFVRSVHAPPAQIKRYATMWITRHTLPSSLRSLPAKTPLWQRLVTVADYAPPLSPLSTSLNFPGAVKSPAPCHVCYIGSLTRSSHHRVAIAGSHHRVPLWQRRHWRRGFNQSDLLVSRYHAGCTANGIAKPSHVQGHCDPAFSQCPAAQAQPEKSFRLELPVQGRHMVIVDDVVPPEVPSQRLRSCFYAMVRRLPGLVPLSNLVEPR